MKRKKTNKKKKKKTNKQTTTKQAKIGTKYDSPCLHHRWRCYQTIALNDQKVGSTSLSPLSPYLNDATQ